MLQFTGISSGGKTKKGSAAQIVMAILLVICVIIIIVLAVLLAKKYQEKEGPTPSPKAEELQVCKCLNHLVGQSKTKRLCKLLFSEDTSNLYVIDSRLLLHLFFKALETNCQNKYYP